jgi:hypothetical protein
MQDDAVVGSPFYRQNQKNEIKWIKYRALNLGKKGIAGKFIRIPERQVFLFYGVSVKCAPVANKFQVPPICGLIGE